MTANDVTAAIEALRVASDALAKLDGIKARFAELKVLRLRLSLIRQRARLPDYVPPPLFGDGWQRGLREPISL